MRYAVALSNYFDSKTTSITLVDADDPVSAMLKGAGRILGGNPDTWGIDTTGKTTRAVQAAFLDRDMSISRAIPSTRGLPLQNPASPHYPDHFVERISGFFPNSLISLRTGVYFQ